MSNTVFEPQPLSSSTIVDLTAYRQSFNTSSPHRPTTIRQMNMLVLSQQLAAYLAINLTIQRTLRSFCRCLSLYSGTNKGIT